MQFPESKDERLQLLHRVHWTYHPFRYYQFIPAKKIKYDPSWLAEQTSCNLVAGSVSVMKLDTLEAASLLDNPLILILADDIRPGGNYLALAGMQEESLFLRSALWRHLTKDLYPIKNDEAIYAKDVPLLDGRTYSFIACPGLRNPQMTKNGFSDEDSHILRCKIELILQIAKKHNHDNLILGALGSGVFACSPQEVASIFKKVLGDRKEYFKNIIFAVLGANFNLFDNIIAQ